MSVIINGDTGITTPAETVQGALTTTGNTILGDASTDTLNVGNGGLVKDASGNVGVGVTPSAWLSTDKAIELTAGALDSVSATDIRLYQNAYNGASGSVYKTSNFASLYRQTSGQHIFYNAPSGTAGATVTLATAMTLGTTGDLLVGGSTVSSGARLMVKSTANDWTTYFESTGASNPYGMFMKYTAASPNGTGNEFLDFRDSSTTRFQVRSNGGIANYSANNVNLSDRREKTNFAPAGDYLDKICAIPVQTFNYIDQNLEEDDGLTLGVVAQDVQAICPEMVMESNWGTEEEPKMRLSIYQTDLQYALMKCIQEQQAIIIQLQADVATLKALSA